MTAPRASSCSSRSHASRRGSDGPPSSLTSSRAVLPATPPSAQKSPNSCAIPSLLLPPPDPVHLARREIKISMYAPICHRFLKARSLLAPPSLKRIPTMSSVASPHQPPPPPPPP